jgi:hypothetical protein
VDLTQLLNLLNLEHIHFKGLIMSHFAKVENGIVTQVIVAEQDFIDTGLVGNPLNWIKTSYNTRGGIHYEPNSKTPREDQSGALRKNYAGIGYTYDVERDAFIAPKPYPSWTLDEETCLWNSPTPIPPTDDKSYIWDEENLIWKQI